MPLRASTLLADCAPVNFVNREILRVAIEREGWDMSKNSGRTKGMGKADRATKKRGKSRSKIESSKHTHRQRNT
jgi:hypothetical protein